MQLRSALILFVLFVGACTSEGATPVGLLEPTVEAESAPEQPAAGTGQAAQEDTVGPRPGDNVIDFCFPQILHDDPTDESPPSNVGWLWEDYIRWFGDGSQVLFTFNELYRIDSIGFPQSKLMGLLEGIDLEGQSSTANHELDILNAPDRDPLWAKQGLISFVDVSPDSSRIVFSACTYTELTEREKERLGWELAEDTGGRSWVDNLEIMVSNIDGTNLKRLTENLHLDMVPVWSPDGSKIAFTSDPYTTILYTVRQFTIYTVAAGSFDQVALDAGVRAYAHRPAWSPDGERIAFVGQEVLVQDWGKPPGIYTIGVEGSGMTRISDAASGPAWSPDGRRIAVVVPSGEGEYIYDTDGVYRPDVDLELYTFAADGSDPILVNSSLPEAWYEPVDPWLGDLSWSPDGSEILLKGFGHRVPLDGSPSADVGPGFLNPPFIPRDASWSPDGSMIAFFGHDTEDLGLLMIADRNGENVRTLLDLADIEREFSQID